MSELKSELLSAEPREVRKLFEDETNADAVMIDPGDDHGYDLVVRLVYHPPEKDRKLVKTEKGLAIAEKKEECELDPDECKEKFSEYDPDEVRKYPWDHGGQYEVSLHYGK